MLVSIDEVLGVAKMFSVVSLVVLWAVTCPSYEIFRDISSPLLVGTLIKDPFHFVRFPLVSIAFNEH